MDLNWCRACLKKEERLVSFQNNNEIVQAFMDLANIFIDPSNEKWSLHVCNQCLTKIYEFCEFRRQMIASNAFLLDTADGSVTNYESLEKALLHHWNSTLIHSNSLSVVKLEQNHQETNETDNENRPEGVNVEVDAKTSKEKVIKEEYNTEEPEAEVFEYLNIEEYRNDDDYAAKVKKQKRQAKKTLKTKKTLTNKKKREKSKPVSPAKKARPRTLLEIDPSKITIVELTTEEQLKEQRAEGLKQSYLSMPYKCEKCFTGFNFERKLKAHDLNRHKPNSPFTCGICTKTMSSEASLKVHLNRHQILYQCNLCHARDPEKARALAHYKTIHEGVQQHFPCKQCDLVFRYRSSRNGHVRRHHPTTARPKCDVCHKSFSTTDSLEDHMLIHSGEKNYACKVCDKRFRLRQAVDKHMLTHSSLRAHYCIECDISFKSVAALASHRRYASAHASPRLLKQNTCDKCGRSFSQRCRLLEHVSRHAGRQGSARRAPAPRVRYVCHCCGRGFTARGTLSNHLLTHTGARPHACTLCDARFTQLATLRTHRGRVHAGNTGH